MTYNLRRRNYSCRSQVATQTTTGIGTTAIALASNTNDDVTNIKEEQSNTTTTTTATNPTTNTTTETTTTTKTKTTTNDLSPNKKRRVKNNTNGSTTTKANNHSRHEIKKPTPSDDDRHYDDKPNQDDFSTAIIIEDDDCSIPTLQSSPGMVKSDHTINATCQDDNDNYNDNDNNKNRPPSIQQQQQQQRRQKRKRQLLPTTDTTVAEITTSAPSVSSSSPLPPLKTKDAIKITRTKSTTTATTSTTRKQKKVKSETKPSSSPPPSSSSSSRSKSKSSSKSSVPLSLPPPEGWEDIYSLVEELRSDRTAPVDHAGAEKLPERHRGEKVFRFQVLIALMLSSQTKDAVVGEAMKNLQSLGLDVDNVAQMSTETLNRCIGKVGFHNTKTKHIQQVVTTLQTDFGGDIPSTAAEMIQYLPGVGPKMAYICENIAWNKQSGIGIDTHMHRMFHQLQWVSPSKKAKSPEQTRIQLEAWLPQQKWSTVNYLWVGFGQEVQQQKSKILQKAIHCSRPGDALRLLQKLGMNIQKEGKKYGLDKQIHQILQAQTLKVKKENKIQNKQEQQQQEEQVQQQREEAQQ